MQKLLATVIMLLLAVLGYCQVMTYAGLRSIPGGYRVYLKLTYSNGSSADSNFVGACSCAYPRLGLGQESDLRREAGSGRLYQDVRNTGGDLRGALMNIWTRSPKDGHYVWTGVFTLK